MPASLFLCTNLVGKPHVVVYTEMVMILYSSFLAILGVQAKYIVSNPGRINDGEDACSEHYNSATTSLSTPLPGTHWTDKSPSTPQTFLTFVQMK
jgi:hypothetical protein